MTDYYNIKNQWNKGYIIYNECFTCGIFTTQRVESIHATFRNLCMDANSSLQELLQVIKKNSHPFNGCILEEKHSQLPKKASKIYENVAFIKYFKGIVSPYVLEKLKLQFEMSLNYNIITIEDPENIQRDNKKQKMVFFL